VWALILAEELENRVDDVLVNDHLDKILIGFHEDFPEQSNGFVLVNSKMG
jgi:hypothetical protein